MSDLNIKKTINEGQPTKKRKIYSSPQGRSTCDVATQQRNVRGPLLEEISDVLDLNNVGSMDRPKLENDLMQAMEELAIVGGDTADTWTNVRNILFQSTELSEIKTEDISTNLVNKARELSLITHTNDSNYYSKVRFSKSETPKVRLVDAGNDAIDTTQIQLDNKARKIKSGSEIKSVCDFSIQFKSNEEEQVKNIRSVKLVPDVNKNVESTIFKMQLKRNLMKNINNVVKDCTLPKARKKPLKEKLINIVEKDLAQTSLSQRQDLQDAKQTMINNMNKILEVSKFPKDTFKYLRFHIGLALNKELNGSPLMDTEKKHRLSRNLDEVVSKLPINTNEKKDLKTTLQRILSNELAARSSSPQAQTSKSARSRAEEISLTEDISRPDDIPKPDDTFRSDVAPRPDDYLRPDNVSKYDNSAKSDVPRIEDMSTSYGITKPEDVPRENMNNSYSVAKPENIQRAEDMTNSYGVSRPEDIQRAENTTNSYSAARPEDIPRAENMTNAYNATRPEDIPRAEDMTNSYSAARPEDIPRAENLSKSYSAARQEDIPRSENMTNSYNVVRPEDMPRAENMSNSYSAARQEDIPRPENMTNSYSAARPEDIPRAENMTNSYSVARPEDILSPFETPLPENTAKYDMPRTETVTKPDNPRNGDILRPADTPRRYSFEQSPAYNNFVPNDYSTPNKNTQRADNKPTPVVPNVQPYLVYNTLQDASTGTEIPKIQLVASKEAEDQYRANIKNIIRAWMVKIPLDLNEDAKENLVGAWTADVVDRKKYLQVHPLRKSSDSLNSIGEELDILKYQVYRRLFKVVEDINIVLPFIRKTDELFQTVNQVEVPLMIVSMDIKPSYKGADDEDIPPFPEMDATTQVPLRVQELPTSTPVSEQKKSMPVGASSVPDPRKFAPVSTSPVPVVREEFPSPSGQQPSGLPSTSVKTSMKRMCPIVKIRRAISSLPIPNIRPPFFPTKRSPLQSFNYTGEEEISTIPALTDSAAATEDETLNRKSYAEGGELSYDKRKCVPAQRIIENLMTPLHEEIADILDLHDVPSDERLQMETDLAKILEQLATGYEDPDKMVDIVRENIKHLTNLSGDDAENLTNRLVGIVKEMSLIARIQRKSASEIDRQQESVDTGTNIVDELKESLNESTQFNFSIFSFVFEEDSSNSDLEEDEMKQMFLKGGDEYDRDLNEGFGSGRSQRKKWDLRPMNELFFLGPAPDIGQQIDTWADVLPPIQRMNEEDRKQMEAVKAKLMSDLQTLLPTANAEEMKKIALKYLLEMPIDEEMKKDPNRMNEKAKELIENLLRSNQRKPDQQYGMSFYGLSDQIEAWMDSLDIRDDTMTKEDNDKLKTDMAHNLINNIGEMNIDPEIFNDVKLYEDVLRDEINHMLENVNIANEDIEKMKEDLIEKVKAAHNRARDEVSGQTYKQQLRDTMSRHFPDPTYLSHDEQAALELMKDQLADAFINLHYSGNDEDQKDKLKRRISAYLNEFCNNFLRQHPDKTINCQKLNNDLYEALKRIPVPPENSMRYEVEQVRIRDEINEWLKELPLLPQSPSGLYSRNKMVYVLSKRLFDIEKQYDPAEQVPIMKKEIVKWLKKMPFEAGLDKTFEDYADKLVERLKATESSRIMCEYSNLDDDVCMPRPCPGPCAQPPIDETCPYYRSLMERQRLSMRRPPCARKKQPPPTCTLTPEDMAHLERIRQRACLNPQCISSLLRGKRSTGAGPRPVDAGSQTEIKPDTIPFGKPAYAVPSPEPIRPRPDSGVSRRPCTPECFAPWKPTMLDTSAKSSVCEPYTPGKSSHTSPVCPSSRQTRRPCSGIPLIPSSASCCPDRRQNTSASCGQSYRRGEVQPQIIIKEYYWDSPENQTKVHESESQQPTLGQQQPQSYPQPKPTFDNSFLSPGPRCSHCQQKMPQSKSSHGSITWSRVPFSSSRLSCCPPPQQSTQQETPGASCGYDYSRMPKRNGLQDQSSSNSRPFRKERVIELGSLDDLREPRPKRRNDQFEWCYPPFADEDNFWGGPGQRRVLADEGIDEPLLMEREKREERVRCKCKERLVPKGTRNRHRNFDHIYQTYNEDNNNINRCSKCCGIHCPYPSHLYFR